LTIGMMRPPVGPRLIVIGRNRNAAAADASNWRIAGDLIGGLHARVGVADGHCSRAGSGRHLFPLRDVLKLYTTTDIALS
jgi:hypothetical protein